MVSDNWGLMIFIVSSSGKIFWEKNMLSRSRLRQWFPTLVCATYENNQHVVGACCHVSDLSDLLASTPTNQFLLVTIFLYNNTSLQKKYSFFLQRNIWVNFKWETSLGTPTSVNYFWNYNLWRNSNPRGEINRFTSFSVCDVCCSDVCSKQVKFWKLSWWSHSYFLHSSTMEHKKGPRAQNLSTINILITLIASRKPESD